MLSSEKMDRDVLSHHRVCCYMCTVNRGCCIESGMNV